MGALTSLRVLFTSGEAVTPALANTTLSHLRDTQFWNLYGPTEAAVEVTATQIRSGAHVAPIGRPLWNTNTYVLDSRLRMVPPGVTGELYLGGVQLAQGYAGQPALTSERFVAAPFGEPGSRLYRTGDLVRWNNSGDIEYLGRNDFQVKLRGRRLELGEIESVLSGVEGVVHVAAGVVQMSGGDHVVAYLAPDSVDLDAAKVAVAQRLPEYMRPTLWVPIPVMPLSSAGKVDRRALPDPVLPDVEYVAPSSDAEVIIADIYADVLDVEQVSVIASFFDVGGNSLGATKVVSRLSVALDRRVPVAAIFEAQSVAELAKYVSSADVAHRPPLVARESGDRGSLSTVQRGVWLINRADPSSSAYNIAMAMRLEGDLDQDALRSAMEDVLRRHESLRTIYPMVDGEPIQIVLPPEEALAAIEYRVVAVAGDPSDVVADITDRGFDVTAAPPVRIAVLALGPHDHIMVVVIHHIAADGGSTGPLAQDVMTAYAARAAGHAPEWPPLPIQYLDFALWQQRLLANTERDARGEGRRQLDYWMTRLRGAPRLLELPLDRPRPRVASTRGAEVVFDIDADVVAGLDAVAREQQASLFMITHAAFAVLLSRLSNQREVVIGTPYGGRGEAALDHLIGMFVNTLALRTDIHDDEPFTDMLARVRDSDLADMDNIDVSFDSIVGALGERMPTAYNPVYQAMFAFQNFVMPTVELPGLTISPVSEQLIPAKVDLQLTLFPAGAGRDMDVDAPMRAQFIYVADLFDESTVSLFADCYLRLLSEIAKDPSTVVGDLSIADGELEVVHGEGVLAPGIEPLFDLVSAASVADPDSVAVRDGEAEVTFAALMAMTSVLVVSLPDGDSALTSALMALMPTVAAAGARRLSDALEELRRNAEEVGHHGVGPLIGGIETP